ncbi:hypothetical protein NMG60_11024654 [Bertholletia excelsa]
MFSLDGKDAMYCSSFQNTKRGSLSFCNGGTRKGLNEECSSLNLRLPPVLGGESVVWCKPGLVAKLMGLEAVPVPLHGYCRTQKVSSVMKKQNMRKKAERREIERRKLVREGMKTSCSTKPIAVHAGDEDAGWPIQRLPKQVGNWGQSN